MKEVKVIEKPDWVTWDQIHDVIFAAHAENRDKGVVMSLPSLPGDEIRKLMEKGGKFFVALDGEKVIATAAVRFRNISLWCHHGDTAYLCFASVLPEYRGTGVYKKLCEARSLYLDSQGYRVYYADTHERNKRVQEILGKQGYRHVGVKQYGDHYNELLIKWLGPCPYSDNRIRLEYLKSVLIEKYLRPVKRALRKMI